MGANPTASTSNYIGTNRVIGSKHRVRVVKNKVSPPFKQAEFDIMYGKGISREGEILDMGVNAKILEKSGAWYAYKDAKIGQGREAVKVFLKENPKVLAEIEKTVREKVAEQES